MAAGPQHGDTKQVCAVSTKPGSVTCQAVIKLVSAARNAPAVSGPDALVAYGPGSLRSAYGLLTASKYRGKGRMVVIVDAYRDPNAAQDLAHYRSHYNLGACTKANGCLHIVNQNGKSSPLPSANAGWAGEESLDLDMVSAICPKCHITLVESYRATTKSLGIAEDTAARKSRFVSNSWSAAQWPGETAYNHYFNHSGHAIVFASGDYGYLDASAPSGYPHHPQTYPGDMQTVVSVGGTKLVHKASGSRPWTETVWGNSSNLDQYGYPEGTQSGCASWEAKPSWQHKSGDTCLRRTQNDVAAVADPNTGVVVYDSYKSGGGNWWIYGGTSVATPIITATFALAGKPADRSYPASYLYVHPKSFHDVTAGANGTCSPTYLCHGEAGFDGPTGVGTPHGTYGLSTNGVNPVTLLDPGARTAQAGASFSLKITGLDQRATAKWLKYTATGLPAGLSIRGISGTTDGRISGTVSAAPGTYQVVVHGQDLHTLRSNATRFTITVS
ncbi:MAG TPA: putative Ig domain-containing protein [Streptosporangiaceae bacterium]|nr:putative Ig domain-containing protein [Streptosporangiaceae bacterium]